MKYLSLIEARKIVLNELGEDDCAIMDAHTLDFKWGALFYWQSKEFVETGENPIIGISPILVDKINGTTHSISYLKTRDKLLENYRKKMGYPYVIKFPVKGDLEKMSDLETVFALMETTEFTQIEKAIEIVKSRNLFDVEGLGIICGNFFFKNLVESISVNFNHIKGEYFLYEYPLKWIPKEIELFKDRITSIYVNVSKIEEIPPSILKLKKLKSISIDATPIKKMPYDLRELKDLKEVNLYLTLIDEGDINKFKLPKGCKIKIENSWKKSIDEYPIE